MKTLPISLFTLLLLTSLSSLADLKVGDKLSEVLQKQDIRFDLDLFNLSVGDSIGLSSEIGLRVFPNNDLQTFSRVEPLKFELTLKHTIPLGILSVSGQKTTATTGEFIRQFSSQKEAFNIFKYPPYIIDNNTITDNKIPFTPEHAIALKNKDYFRYQVRTALTLSGSIGADIGIANLSANKTYVLYGDMQIEVYKKENQKVLVRASSLKQKENKNGLSLKKNFILNLFEVSLLNKVADELIPKELIQFDIQSNTNGSLFAIEYEFDLNHDSAKAAYDHMMNYKNWNFLQLVKVIGGSKEAALTALEMRITAAEDRAKLGLGDVTRVVRSTTHFSETSKGSSFNFRLVRASDNSQFIEQNISMISNPMTDDRQNYRISTIILNEDIGGWLLFNAAQTETDEANIVFQLTPDFKIKKLLEFNFSYQRSDKTFNKINQADTAGHIYKLLPGDIHGPGVRDFAKNLSSYHKDDVFVDMDLSLEPRALVVMNRLSDLEIQSVALSFIDAFFDDQATAGIVNRDFGNQRLHFNVQGAPQTCDTKVQKVKCFQSTYKKDIEKILLLLPEVIRRSATKDYDLQAEKLIQLQKLELFKKAGSGIVTRLLMQGILKHSNDISQFYRFAHLRLHIRGRATAPTTYELGRNDAVENINELFKIRNRILNREYDPLFFEN